MMNLKKNINKNVCETVLIDLFNNFKILYRNFKIFCLKNSLEKNLILKSSGFCFSLLFYLNKLDIECFPNFYTSCLKIVTKMFQTSSRVISISGGGIIC